MIITLAPTKDQDNNDIDETLPDVVIKVPHDDLTINDVLEYLIKPVLIASGYLEETVEKIQVVEPNHA